MAAERKTIGPAASLRDARPESDGSTNESDLEFTARPAEASGPLSLSTSLALRVDAQRRRNRELALSLDVG